MKILLGVAAALLLTTSAYAGGGHGHGGGGHAMVGHPGGVWHGGYGHYHSAVGYHSRGYGGYGWAVPAIVGTTIIAPVLTDPCWRPVRFYLPNGQVIIKDTFVCE